MQIIANIPFILKFHAASLFLYSYLQKSSSFILFKAFITAILVNTDYIG